jgi:hypothetical protein
MKIIKEAKPLTPKEMYRKIEQLEGEFAVLLESIKRAVQGSKYEKDVKKNMIPALQEWIDGNAHGHTLVSIANDLEDSF